MTIEQLQFFLMIEKLKSFSEAANELYISQSTLSKHIKALEKQLGYKLFERTTRKIQITPAGEVFSKYAHRMATEYREMLLETKKFQQELSVLNIAGIPILEAYGMFELFEDFQREYPNIIVEVEEGERTFVLSELRRGAVDMAILRSRFVEGGDLQTVPIFTDEIVMVVPEGHRFAQTGEVSLADATEETFFFLSKNTGMYAYCIEECGKVGYFPNVKKSELNRRSIRSKILRGEGVSLMAETVAKEINLPGLVNVRLKERLSLDLSFILRNEKIGKSCEELIAYVTNRIAQGSCTSARS